MFVTSLDGEQHFELAVGESMTVTDRINPIKISAFSSVARVGSVGEAIFWLFMSEGGLQI